MGGPVRRVVEHIALASVTRLAGAPEVPLGYPNRWHLAHGMAAYLREVPTAPAFPAAMATAEPGAIDWTSPICPASGQQG
jgi:hypothetical protein